MMDVTALTYIESRRLQLIPATPALAEADLAGRQPLAALLGAQVPDNWPPPHHSRPAVEWMRERLRERSAAGWLNWYLVRRGDGAELIGLCGFKGRPDPAGSVEISYALLSQFHNQGFATEAVRRLVVWAFGHARVREVSAETLPHLRASIRVLEKCGFSPAGRGSETGALRYLLPRERLR